MTNQVSTDLPKKKNTTARGSHAIDCSDCKSAKLTSIEGESAVQLVVRSLLYGWKRGKCPTCLQRQFNRAKL